MIDFIKIFAINNDFVERAKKLAQENKIEFGGIFSKNDNHNMLCLLLTEKGLTLTDGKIDMIGDFEGEIKRLIPNNLNGEMIVKATKIKNSSNYTVIDATAGMGEDSFLLAGAGFDVYLYEYNPIIYLLLKDSLDRAIKSEKLKPIIDKMHIKNQDSITAMKNLDFSPDIILLDPMFPARSKSGLIKKKFQLLQKLEMPCDNEKELLSSALNTTAKKIVIKRPLHAEYLGNKKPSYSIFGSAIRYDIITK